MAHSGTQKNASLLKCLFVQTLKCRKRKSRRAPLSEALRAWQRRASARVSQRNPLASRADAKNAQSARQSARGSVQCELRVDSDAQISFFKKKTTSLALLKFAAHCAALRALFRLLAQRRETELESATRIAIGRVGARKSRSAW